MPEQAIEEPQAKLGDLVLPTPGRLVVQVKVEDEVTKSGIVIPRDTARSIHEQKATQGVVVSMGEDDLEDAAIIYEVGDTVLFGKYSGTEIKYTPPGSRTEQKVVVLNHKDILAKLVSPEEASRIKITR